MAKIALTLLIATIFLVALVKKGEAQAYDIVSRADFNNRVKNAGSKLVLIEFMTTWCGACTRSIPQVKELAQKYASKVVVLIVDHEKYPKLWSKKYGKLGGYPTFVFLKNGRKLETTSGFSQAKIERLTKKLAN